MSSTPTNSRGAVDLSGLADRAKQPDAAPGRTGGSSYVLEVTEQTFDAEVVRRSLNYPVIIEFYTLRAQGAEQLSASLAELATEAAGKFLVARMNVDAAPQFAQQIGLQQVPTVVAALQGQLIPLFQGVVSKEEIRGALDQVTKAAVANGIVGRAEPVGQPAGEEDDGEPDPRFAAAYEAMETGDFATAVEEFDKLLQANPKDTEAEVGKAQASLLLRTAELDPEAAVAAASAPDAPIDAQLTAADAELASGDADAAFARLIGVIRRTSGDDRNAVRVRLLELFETLGNSDPRVQKARRDLMTALF
ncbi:co-chaperone YbbN [Microlunatus endophyticus]|uniref:Co-chaperone YbbN n=1 Tax=Microlunatus endophyticus TaxID=1716077 RepID=A0A917W2G1_9ACTN|nr:tetratricopeptide repeat protein [Microlunatus endophyticus]GGL55171.1 co-chaperone YbbN [Microlunatus endophyticus]